MPWVGLDKFGGKESTPGAHAPTRGTQKNQKNKYVFEFRNKMNSHTKRASAKFFLQYLHTSKVVLRMVYKCQHGLEKRTVMIRIIQHSTKSDKSEKNTSLKPKIHKNE